MTEGAEAGSVLSIKPALKPAGAPDLDDPEHYINRELSWLRFNERVLEEALDPSCPLLDRVSFLSIFSSNLDEFFMIRVSGLRRQLAGGALQAPPDGMTPGQQLAAIRELVLPLVDEGAKCWQQELVPQLEAEGIRIRHYEDLSSDQHRQLRERFQREIFPALTPLAFDPGHPFPHISNLSINLAVVVNDPKHGERFARLKVPHMFPRLLGLRLGGRRESTEMLGLGDKRPREFVFLEEVVAENLDLLFPGLDIVASYPFRVTRDADFEIEEDEASDLLTAMQEVVGQRHFGSAVRLEIDLRTPPRIRQILTDQLELAPYQVYATSSPLGMADLTELARLNVADLKAPPFRPRVAEGLAAEDDLFATVRSRDVLLYHPYDAFTPVVDFLRQAAIDPDVLAIKQTLYRVGPDSPIVQALMEARGNGKQVSALVELKARFDEANNIDWARALERAGVHVVYGLLGLKTHAKMCLVVRREGGDIVRYAHLGTGNYNPVTARVYTDLGYLTCDPGISADVSDLFNALTGYSLKRKHRKLLVAPQEMRTELLARIDREIAEHRENGGGHLAFKVNSLVDQACIKALYRASQAGVRVDLQVRGICCLRPGLAGVSENIKVTSIVGRFLEHTRIYYFRNGGEEEILLGSADLMPRNLDSRVEILFPLQEARLRRALRDEILFLHLGDNVKARQLKADHSWHRITPSAGEPTVHSQLQLLAGADVWHLQEGAREVLGERL